MLGIIVNTSIHINIDVNTIGFHNFKSQNFKLSVSNPESKYVAYVSVLSQVSNCQGLGGKSKHEFLKTDRIYIYIYIYTYTIYIYIYVYIHTYIHTYRHTDIQTYRHTHLYVMIVIILLLIIIEHSNRGRRG